MPTCEPCGTFYNPNSLPADGTCPECGGPVSTGDHGHVEEPVTRKVPWHFWVGVAAISVYLVWRLIQGIALLF
ncbi:MAG: hypothetical protein ACC660_06705 [Acidimicrobiales bacterium]